MNQVFFFALPYEKGDDVALKAGIAVLVLA